MIFETRPLRRAKTRAIFPKRLLAPDNKNMSTAPINDSNEPRFVFLYEDKYKLALFGIFVAFLFLFIICQSNIYKVNIYWFLVAPFSSMILFSYLPPSFGHVIDFLCVIADFPASIAESVLFINLVCNFSRWYRSYLVGGSANRVVPKRNELIYKGTSFLIGLVTMTLSWVLLLYGLDYSKINGIHGASMGFVFVAVLLTMIIDNGIFTDSCMVVLRTALSLCPILSRAGSGYTVFLRVFFVVLSFLTLCINFFPGSIKRSVSSPQFKSRNASRAACLLAITYVLLSPNAFIRPISRNCGFQSVICPIVYVVLDFIESRS